MAMAAPRGGNWREQGNALVEHGLNSFKGLVPINAAGGGDRFKGNSRQIPVAMPTFEDLSSFDERIGEFARIQPLLRTLRWDVRFGLRFRDPGLL
jgi:hypothetical protein